MNSANTTAFADKCPPQPLTCKTSFVAFLTGHEGFHKSSLKNQKPPFGSSWFQYLKCIYLFFLQQHLLQFFNHVGFLL